MNTEQQSGTLWGVNWERHSYGVYCYAMGGNLYLQSRKYLGDGCNPVRVRECVQHFRREVLNKY